MAERAGGGGAGEEEEDLSSLPLVLWSTDDETDENSVENEPEEAPREFSRTFSSLLPSTKLGFVTYVVRGRDGEGYSARRGQLTEDCRIIPLHGKYENTSAKSEGSNRIPRAIRCNSVDKISTLYDFEVSISLEQWLSLVKQESSRKAPLPKNWQ
eukprot:765738-Hanusia_phi.AAC.4